MRASRIEEPLKSDFANSVNASLRPGQVDADSESTTTRDSWPLAIDQGEVRDRESVNDLVAVTDAS